MTALEHVAAPTPVLEAVATSGEKQGSIRAYVRRLAITDAVAIVGSVAAAQLVRFGTDPATLVSRLSPYSYTLVSGVLVAAWIAALLISRSRDPRAVGNGVDEYRRVARASTALFGVIAIVGFLLKLDVARGYLAVAFPLGVSSLLLTRWLWRNGLPGRGVRAASYRRCWWLVPIRQPRTLRKSSRRRRLLAIGCPAYVSRDGRAQRQIGCRRRARSAGLGR